MSIRDAKGLMETCSREESLGNGTATGKTRDCHVYESRYGDPEIFKGPFGWFWRFSAFIDSFGEARGVERQPTDMRGKGGLRQYAELTLIWLGACGGLPSMTGFFGGCLGFQLSFRDSMSSAIAGAFFGCVFAGFGVMNGPKSGLRQMISTRFQFGWWPAKFVALLDILTVFGWAVIGLVFGGQLLSALNPNIPLEAGIIIISAVSLFVAVFGVRFVTLFDKVFVGPALIAFLLVYVCTGSEWPASTSVSVGTPADIRAHWLSNFSACVGITSTWIGFASDYFVDLPANSNPWVVYTFFVVMLFVPTIFVGISGLGISSAAAFSNEKWGDAYKNLGEGGLLATSMAKWGGGGKFIVVLMFISLITNNIMNTYSIALSSQTFGRIWTKVPRYILSIIVAIIYCVLASAGREKLSDILANFLPMIGYWSMIYAGILLIENLVFRRSPANEYQWEYWNTRGHFPTMWAAIFSFCAGVAGVVVGMNQTYYTGKLAAMIGSEGGDIGIFLSLGFSMIAYLPSRYIEIKLRKERPIRP